MNEKAPRNLKRELRIYRISLAITLTVILALGYLRLVNHWKQNSTKTQQSQTFPDVLNPRQLPYYEQVLQIISPLEYSGLPTLLKQDVRMTIDFDKQTWTLHNLHEYNDEGDILLDAGRYGLCGELAGSIFKRIKKLFGADYEIKFAKVSESGFFLTPQSTHIVLLAHNKINGESYLIDPSFHKYGRQADLDEYLFFGIEDSLSFIDQKSPDISFAADHAMPILIRHNFLLQISVGKTEGKFDPNNFVLSVIATERYKFSGRYLFAIRKINGQTQEFENKWLLNETLDPKDHETIHDALMRWFQQTEKQT